MSFDDGFNPEMTSDEDFRAKFAVLWDETDIGFSEMCRLANVQSADVCRAIECGTYGLMATSEILIRSLAVYGLGLDYLLAPLGSASARLPRGSSPPESQALNDRRKLRGTVWDFIVRNGLPRRHRRPLLNECLKVFDQRPQHTLRIAARPGVARTMTDVAYVYERMLRQGRLE